MTNRLAFSAKAFLCAIYNLKVVASESQTGKKWTFFPDQANVVIFVKRHRFVTPTNRWAQQFFPIFSQFQWFKWNRSTIASICSLKLNSLPFQKHRNKKDRRLLIFNEVTGIMLNGPAWIVTRSLVNAQWATFVHSFKVSGVHGVACFQW